VPFKEAYAQVGSSEGERCTSLHILGEKAVKALEKILKSDLPHVSPKALDSIARLETRILPCWFHSEDEGWKEHNVDGSRAKQLAARRS
jgi:hypothetical protein